MAINIKFDLINNPEPPTLILANRNGNKLGQLNVNHESIELIDKFNDASEVSFTVNKYLDGKITNLWDKIVDFKLVYCKEWDCWFECKVELDEATESVKTVFCTQLGQAELSQIMLYDIEINTEDDIARDDYKIGILYDPDDRRASILDRILEKAPHYSIRHVDETLKNIQRSFSFDSTSVYDAFQEIAEEIGCLFVFNSDSDANGMPQRTISVYDLQQNCNGCNYRGEFTDKCPKCGSTNITHGYGEDTLIFVTSDELASEGIQLVTDTDSVKNCFKLEAGDDLMTATIRNRNPNGTDYIWYFSDATKSDMPSELVEKIESYDEEYKYYYNDYQSNLDSNLLSQYNSLVDKYLKYNEDLEKISNPVKGFSSLMQAYYNTIDLGWYLKSGLMPNVTIGETNASEQALLLEVTLPPLIGVTNLKVVSKATADSSILTMAKAIVDSAYKVVIDSSSLSDNSWSGKFIITNYSDDEDTYTTGIISRTLTDSDETYVRQKIEKILSKENTDDLSITGLFAKDYDEFCSELKKYALTPLTSFHDACQACLDILIEQGAGSDSHVLYDSLYSPYYEKLMAIEEEMAIRENEVNIILGVYNENNKLIKDGLQTNIEKLKVQIQNNLDFQSYLGEELWLQFCAYRREDKYSNSNYISDGLNNAELFEKALEFYRVAENEIFKSAELQHSISATLNNLLAIPKFKPLVESFEVGNWIRVQIDDYVYKLRLVEYEISYGDFDSISVKFSDVAKVKTGYSDLEDILSSASSMASSYDSIKRQANLGNEARNVIRQWITSGLDASLVQIQNNTNEDITIDNNGIIGRSYSDITEEYSPEQIRITHNIIAFTDDNWKSVRQAIGKHKYKYFDGVSNTFIDAIGYGMNSDFCLAGVVAGSQIIGGSIYSPNYVSGKSGTYFDLQGGDFELAGGRFVFDEEAGSLRLKNVTIQWDGDDAANPPTIENISGLSDYIEKTDNLQDQLDNRAETWYQDTDPSVGWQDSETKEVHLGDLWHYTGETGVVNGVERVKNSEWIWVKVNGVYQWEQIEISDEVFDAIDGKAQIFTSTPTPPYYIGDLWVQGSTGDILHCIRDRITGSYSASDWAISSKYTDDTIAKQALEQAKQGIADAAEGIKLANDAQDAADNAFNRAENAETNAKSHADSKANTAETNAKNYADLQDNSLSDELTTAYEKYTDSEISTLDSYVAKYLGLGGGTLIGTNYIVSPLIEGGYLNITNVNNNSRVIIDPNNLTGNGYIFQVHNGTQVSVGIDKNGNALFQGSIYATSLTLGDNVKISTDDVSGLSSVATSGNYNDLTNKPTIPTSVGELGLDTSKIMYKGDITQITKTDSNGISYVETSVPSSNGTNITYSTYNAGDYIVFGRDKGTNEEGKDYFCISTNGLLTARNAIIYGTIYATDGEFTGKVTATSGEIGGCSISNGELKVPSANITGTLTADYIVANADIQSPTIYGADIYASTFYAVNGDKDTYATMEADGFKIYHSSTINGTPKMQLATSEDGATNYLHLGAGSGGTGTWINDKKFMIEQTADGAKLYYKHEDKEFGFQFDSTGVTMLGGGEFNVGTQSYAVFG